MASIGVVFVMCGCHRAAPPVGTPATHGANVAPATTAAQPNTIVAPPTARPANANVAPLPLNLRREELTGHVLDSLRKRVMGRRVSYREVKRVAEEIGPIVREAVQQPTAQAGLAELARDEGISIDEARDRWTAWQEADLLLESGGDPDAISSSNAEGVAQWLAGTGHGAGLRINLKESRRLTAKITDLRWQMAWMNYLARPDADPNLSGKPPILPPASALPRMQAEIETLRTKRRNADARFDPRSAIFAQTRYLLRLYKRFPSPDWLFQAYHGGEGGAKRTLQRFFLSAWPGDTALAIRFGNQGQRLRFEDLYFATTPRTRPQAFAYLFGRSDDHRHYWWKLRVSAEALAAFRSDPAAFEKRWLGYAPGKTTDGWWYPQAASQSLPDLAALQKAHAQKQIVAIPADPGWNAEPLPDVPESDQTWYAALRPEALGALRLVRETCRQAGEAAPLPLGDLITTQTYVAHSRCYIRPNHRKGVSGRQRVKPLCLPFPARRVISTFIQPGWFSTFCVLPARTPAKRWNTRLTTGRTDRSSPGRTQRTREAAAITSFLIHTMPQR